MTVTLPILDIFVVAALLFLFSLSFYQGWRICFKKREEPLFPYKIMRLIANFFGKGQEFREGTSHLNTSFILDLQGVFALVGGVLGIILCVIFIINIISRIEIY